MPAPRKYSEAQREAMYRLYLQGLGPTDIARACASGQADVPAFTIPIDSARHIVRSMALERGELARRPEGQTQAQAIAELIEKELARRSPDADKLKSLATAQRQAELAARHAPPAPPSNGNGAKPPKTDEGVLARLARELDEDRDLARAMLAFDDEPDPADTALKALVDELQQPTLRKKTLARYAERGFEIPRGTRPGYTWHDIQDRREAEATINPRLN